MRTIRFATIALCLTGIADAANGDEQEFKWGRNLAAAQRKAQETGKLVVIHFGAEWCNPCQRLEKNVFAVPGFGAELNEYFVGVKLDKDQYPSTAEQFNVGPIPCDVVITPEGAVLHQQISSQIADQYVQSLIAVAESTRDDNERLATEDGRADGAPSRAVRDARVRGKYSNAYVDPNARERETDGPSTNPDSRNGKPSWRNMTEEDHRRSRSNDVQQRTASRYSRLREESRRENVTATEEEQIEELEAQNADLQGEGEARRATAEMKTRDRGPRTDTIDRGADKLRSQRDATSSGRTAKTGRSNRFERSRDDASPKASDEDATNATASLGPSSKRVRNQYVDEEVRQSSTSDFAVAARPTDAALPKIPPGNPPLALDGFSVVTMAEKTSWVRGDVRYGAIHRGRTYLFADATEQKRFLADPDQYAPVISGNDPVAVVDGDGTVAGDRMFGLRHEGRLYFFANEANLSKFDADPDRYIRGLLVAMKKPARRR